MCFTIMGRAQTRLLSLLWPLCATAIFATLQHSSDYWTLFNLMVVVVFALDFGVYAWVINYQPRWLTIALGAVEFLIISQILEWLPGIHVGLRPTQALQFYAVAWVGAWITTQVLLPLWWPRWAEDGGEIRYEMIAEQSNPAYAHHNRIMTFGICLMLLCFGVLVGYSMRPVIEVLSVPNRSTDQPILMDVAIERTLHFKGDPKAHVTIIEFSNFQCVDCAQFAVGVGYQIEQTYVRTGVVRYGYQHLAFDPISQQAAEASECAHEQGAFWVYYRRLFDRLVADPHHEISPDELKQFAGELHLNVAAFDACVESGRYRLLVWSDRNAVNALNITSAPTFLINGQLISGAIPFESWQQIIEAEARKLR